MSDSATDADASIAWTAPEDRQQAQAADYSSRSRVTWVDRSGLHLVSDQSGPLAPAHSHARETNLMLKRLMDIVFAATSIVALLPLFLIVAIAVKATSDGPVLFRQARPGKNGQMFKLLKFRTLFAEQCDESGVSQTTKNDHRVTPIGRFLRRTSIDELPQLMNVLKGEMSIVGPRPHVKGMLAAGVDYELLVPHYNSRQLMKPGLTGWAQANGFRGPTMDVAGSRQRIDHDLAYIQNFSIWLDIKIICKTIWREFITGSGF